MPARVSKGMRDYWDDGARRNAPWYVDTALSYEEPDMATFVARGEEIVAGMVDDAPVPPAGHGLAVEIGPGLGRVCAALASRFDEVVGIDVSPEMVRRAQALVDDPRVDFRLGDGAGLGGLPDACADLVLSFTVFQHIPRKGIVLGYLEEAARVLRPGGLLAFQWNGTPGARRWAAKRVLLGALQRSGVHAERYRRHAPEFLGCRIPLGTVRRTLGARGMELAGTKGEGTLFSFAWAVKRPTAEYS